MSKKACYDYTVYYDTYDDMWVGRFEINGIVAVEVYSLGFETLLFELADSMSVWGYVYN